MFGFSVKIMKPGSYTILFIILAIFLSFFTPLNGLGVSVSTDHMYAEPFRQESYINLKFASILKNDIELEEETSEDDLSICLRLKIDYLYDLEISFYKINRVSLKKILVFCKSSRSPPFI